MVLLSYVASSLVKLFFLKRPSDIFPQAFLESVETSLKKKKMQALIKIRKRVQKCLRLTKLWESL